MRKYLWPGLAVAAAMTVGGALSQDAITFNAFLSNYTRPEGNNYVSVRLLSAPAQGGYFKFKDVCSGCHGVGGQGTDRGPQLNNGSHAGDFRQARAFHSAVGRDIPEHQALMGNSPSFNEVEMMGKFLRELRLQIARRTED